MAERGCGPMGSEPQPQSVWSSAALSGRLTDRFPPGSADWAAAAAIEAAGCQQSIPRRGSRTRRCRRGHRLPAGRRKRACVYSRFMLFSQFIGCCFSKHGSSESDAKCRRKLSLQPPSGAPIVSLLPERCWGHPTIRSAGPYRRSEGRFSATDRISPCSQGGTGCQAAAAASSTPPLMTRPAQTAPCARSLAIAAAS
jgi:hypothetical protein